MASIVLSTAGAAIGGSVGGPAGVMIGQTLGQMAGNAIDNAVFGPTMLPKVHGPRLQDISVQSSHYGTTIPHVFGSSRLAGNVIWMAPVQEIETVTSHTSGGGKGGGSRVRQEQSTYSYTATLAIGLCAGPVDSVIRIWADNREITLPEGSSRFYQGTEEQLPDPAIEGQEGMGNVPAYRGLAYIVLENFPLGDYGNRIPNFTFEVKHVLLGEDAASTPEHLVESMVLIPGSGEFVYHPTIQYKRDGVALEEGFAPQGVRSAINTHNRDQTSDVLVSLNQLQETCPNVSSISVVVGWFGDSLDVATCSLRPGVEFQGETITEPDLWQVGSIDRSSAYLISRDSEGNPTYGGTPSDQSLVALLDELQSRGYEVMLYPMFFMDTPAKPWRGRVTGAAESIDGFFTRADGYDAFIRHYANLVAGRVNAFVIGSELVGITGVQHGDDSFPGVDALIRLATEVRTILGSEVKITYAADWSEYHHTSGGWYHLDPLWASPAIDVVGIDAYFPLTDSTNRHIDTATIQVGWQSGEGYDWFYTDAERTQQTPLDPAYAWKNLRWWWENTHTNPDGQATPWVPQSKPIWFTEYGFPSIDGATNQPNVFYDPTSSESRFPYHSRGQVDFDIQRRAITATENYWRDHSFVEKRFVWRWDARPYPYWPSLQSVWSDGGLWQRGHWVSGKFGVSSLGAVVANLFAKAGLSSADYDVSALSARLDGYMLADQTTIRQALETLQQAYFFDIIESGGCLCCIPKEGRQPIPIDSSALLRLDNNEATGILQVERQQEIELPDQVDISYFNSLKHYQLGNQRAQRRQMETQEKMTVRLPLALSDQQAREIADIHLFSQWMHRTHYRFGLPYRYLYLEPGDQVVIDVEGVQHTIEITEMMLRDGGVLEFQGKAEDLSIYDTLVPVNTEPAAPPAILPDVPDTQLILLDLPLLPGSTLPQQGVMHLAAVAQGENWSGAVLYQSEIGEERFVHVRDAPTQAVVGTVLEALPAVSPSFMDRSSELTVVLQQGELESVSHTAMLGGANIALIGDEIIQFEEAVLVTPHRYTLRGLLRGRLGTESAIQNHQVGERFVLIDSRLIPIPIPLEMIGREQDFKLATIGQTLGQVEMHSFTYQGNRLRPLAPAHIEHCIESDGSALVEWVRRSRAHGGWPEHGDIPVIEEGERYYVEISHQGTILRGEEVSEPRYQYAIADQQNDLGAFPAQVTFSISQLSALVGRGYVSTYNILLLG